MVERKTSTAMPAEALRVQAFVVGLPTAIASLRRLSKHEFNSCLHGDGSGVYSA